MEEERGENERRGKTSPLCALLSLMIISFSLAPFLLFSPRFSFALELRTLSWENQDQRSRIFEYNTAFFPLSLSYMRVDWGGTERMFEVLQRFLLTRLCEKNLNWIGKFGSFEQKSSWTISLPFSLLLTNLLLVNSVRHVTKGTREERFEVFLVCLLRLSSESWWSFLFPPAHRVNLLIPKNPHYHKRERGTKMWNIIDWRRTKRMKFFIKTIAGLLLDEQYKMTKSIRWLRENFPSPTLK